MRRKEIREQMQSQRPTRKRQLFEVSPSPPKKLKKNQISSSPGSSPTKGPLMDNDEDISSFRARSFYGRKSERKSGQANGTATDVSGRVVLSPINNTNVNMQKSLKGSKTTLRKPATKKRHKSLPAERQLKTPDVSESTTTSDVNITPNKNRKFFKHKSPASASKAMGGIIVGKGFNLRFVRGSLNKDFGRSPDRRQGIVMKKTVPRCRKTYSKNVAKSAEAGVSEKCSSPSLTSSMSSCSDKHINNERNIILCTPDGQSSKTSEEESMVLESQSLFSSDTQSLASDMSVENSLLSISEPDMLLSSQKENERDKFYSIFWKQRSDQQQIAPDCSNNLKLAVSPKGSSRKKRFITAKGDNKQLTLDAGQHEFGATQCQMCGMVYTPTDATDEATHTRFHQSAVATLKFPGWKKERIVKDFLDDGSRVILVLPEDQRFMVKKVEEVNHVMGQELGCPDQTFSFHGSYKAFLYISDEKRIEGCCIAEPITQGCRILPNKENDLSENQRPWFCSSTPEPASVGIGRLWVFGPSRKCGIASRLLDCVRQWFEYGIMIDKCHVAFSDPTPDGLKFATKYMGTSNFLVYKYSQ